MVEGTHQRPMVRLVGGLAGLDPRRLRLHRLPADHGADLSRIWRAVERSRLRADDHAVDAADRRRRFRLARRPDRAKNPVDDLDPRLLALQLHRRVFADITIPADLPRIARDIYGSGVARRGGLGDGELAYPLARFHERGPAGVVGDRLCAVELNLGPLSRLYWLARHVVDWRIAGAFGVLCAPVCQGARGLGREPAAATCSEP